MARVLVVITPAEGHVNSVVRISHSVDGQWRGGCLCVHGGVPFPN